MLKFGFIGLNNISEAMCINLLKRPNAMVFVNDNSIARVEYVSNHGAMSCELSSDVVDRADIIIICYDDFVGLQATIYSILNNLNSQKTVLDMSVVSPNESSEINSMLKQTGAEYADLAFLNNIDNVSDIMKKQATVLYGGSSALYLKIQEYLKYMCGNALKVGESSAALSAKVCYNILYAQIQNGVNEMLLYASKSGLLAEDIINAIQSSPLKNSSLQEYGKKVASANHTVQTKIINVHKQLEIAHNDTLQKRIPMKGLKLTKELYDSAIDRKLASHDVTEIFTIVERASHI